VTSQAAFGPPFFRSEGDAPLHDRGKPGLRCIDPGIMKGRVPFAAAFLSMLFAAGCGTQRMYEGPPLPASERAIVRADPVVSAGAPVQLRLRQVDGREVGVSASKVELPPGKHQLIVDCRIAESGSVRRFTLEAELEAGGSYRLVANTTARNCEAVELIGG
jgi:hypothetical protein